MWRNIPTFRGHWFRVLGTLGFINLLSCHSAPPVSPPSVPVLFGGQKKAHPLAVFPLPNAMVTHPQKGVTRWQAQSSADKTRLELYAFDFAANPGLHFEIFDQDEEDAQPFDNQARFWDRPVGKAVEELNQKGHRRIVAAWNGLFFGSTSNNHEGIAEHVSPVVLKGKVHYNFGTHRWTFGVKTTNGKPAFKVIHRPDRATMQREFDWAAGAAQCLIREGKPLQLEPYPQRGQTSRSRPVPSTPAEAGHIPLVDHMNTSRVSIAWARDSHILFVLFVREPDDETASALALRHGTPDDGGWTVADLQRFWQAKGVWGAINSDGGNVAQMTVADGKGKYRSVLPFRPNGREQGGALMYFYVSEHKRK